MFIHMFIYRLCLLELLHGTDKELEVINYNPPTQQSARTIALYWLSDTSPVTLKKCFCKCNLLSK